MNIWVGVLLAMVYSGVLSFVFIMVFYIVFCKVLYFCNILDVLSELNGILIVPISFWLDVLN